jgi:hypothetical protein
MDRQSKSNMPRWIEVNDLMQRGYRYELTAPAGRSFHIRFHPQLTPMQMLELGVFGGRYMTDCRAEFPASWFRGARLCPQRHDPSLNFFGINASQPLSYWQQRGWIHVDDPRGWFQWYCRYYRGPGCAGVRSVPETPKARLTERRLIEATRFELTFSHRDQSIYQNRTNPIHHRPRQF